MKIFKIIKTLYTPASLILIFYFAYINKDLIGRITAAADVDFFLISIGIWCLLHMLSPISTQIILRVLGSKVPYSNLLAIHISRLPARYLPGGIWHTVGRISAYYTYGIPKKTITLLTLSETIYPCIITLFLGGSYLWLAGKHSILTSIEAALALINLIILIIAPLVIRWKFSSYLNENLLKHYLSLIILSTFYWLTASISFLFYYASISPVMNMTMIFKIIFSYIFSWGIGYISIFAPQGIGVFEIVAGNILPIPMNLGGAVAFIAGFRIIILIADCLTWITYNLLKLIFKKQSLKKLILS